MVVVLGAFCTVRAYHSVYLQPELYAPPLVVRQLRQVFPYSIVAGGVLDRQEVVEAMHNDPVTHAHYRDVRVSALVLTRTEQPMKLHVSYRKGDKVYCTKRTLNIPQGEHILTDGKNIIRVRCGNRLIAVLGGSDYAVEATPDAGLEDALETPIPHVARILPGHVIPGTKVLPSSHETGEENEIATTPEPSAWVLYLSGMSFIMRNAWRRRKAAAKARKMQSKGEAAGEPKLSASRQGEL